MAISNPYRSYKENSVTTACPEELVVLMYRGLEKYIKQGQIFINEKNYEKANEVLLKAQDIVSELILSLDMDIDISGQLYNLYDFILVCLREGNIKKESSRLEDALPIVTGLKEAWEGALINIRQIKYGK
ncbi:MAG: flagellar export chaperone FliS [Firmicutes bacterium]|nr:flagellar export chaperone FliS [Bacillota bacterium]MDD3298651.1 flagellar export chaperone FliS [Bacillota bacterium]MDD3851312.1 flagellar export chaperone FliS [Bacillota bacterium]MDD4707166.1 flagellar export chaperone FliS [Bacillota bacterium]